MLTEDRQITSKLLVDQFPRLLRKSLALTNAISRTRVFVVDALDECEKDRKGQQGGELLPQLAQALYQSPHPIKLMVTSRPERSIVKMFEALTRSKMKHTLVDLQAPEDAIVVKSDIRLYLEESLHAIAADPDFGITSGEEWPTRSDLDTLVERADTLFVYASTAVKFIGDFDFDPRNRLKLLLIPARDVSASVASPHKDLDNLYQAVVFNALEKDGVLDDELCSRFRVIAGSIILLFDQLPKAVLASLLRIDTMQMDAMIKRLSSVFLLSEDKPIQVIHPSFPEYLLSESRCYHRFWIHHGEHHSYLALRCLSIMNDGLKYNICGMDDPSTSHRNLPRFQSRVESCISPELQYACKHWMAHLGKSTHGLISPSNQEQQLLKAELIRFCELHSLHWIEATSLLGVLRLSLTGYSGVVSWCKVGCLAFQIPVLLLTPKSTRMLG